MARFVIFSKRIALEALWSFWVTVSLGCDAHKHSTCQSDQISVIWVHLISSSFWHNLKYISNFNFDIKWISQYQWNASQWVLHHLWFVERSFLTVAWSLTWCLVVILFIWTHSEQIGPKIGPNNTSSPGTVCLCLYILISDAIVRLPPQILATGVSNVTFHTPQKVHFRPPSQIITSNSSHKHHNQSSHIS
jgi:hypothetical protein